MATIIIIPTEEGKIGTRIRPSFIVVNSINTKPPWHDNRGSKMAAITAIMVTWWICESAPIPVTSLLPLILMPLLGLTSTAKAAIPYASDIIFLYMGGFFIALAMQRWNLHKGLQ